MARLANARNSHMARWVIPVAKRLLIEESCKNAPTRPLGEVAHIEMGQSPDGDSCNDNGEGVPLIGGPADLGIEFPQSTRWTNAPTKLCRSEDIIVCVRATIGEPRWADGIYCLGRGVAGIRPIDKNLLPRFLFFIIEGNEQFLQSKGTGTTFKTISKEHLASIQVPMIPSEEQVIIVSFLVWLELNSHTRPNFLDAPPLPASLANQSRIVARIEELTARIEEARGLRREAVEEVEALFVSLITQRLQELPVNGSLGEVLLGKPRNGWSARCDNQETGVPVLTLAAVTGFHYRETEFKRTSEPTLESAHYWLQPGDLLITRSNTPNLVGHAAIYNGSPSPCIYPDLMMRLEVNEQIAYNRFVHYWLRSVPVREYIRRTAKGTSPTMKKISQETVMNIPFPSSLSLQCQQQLVKYMDDLDQSVNKLKQLQSETSAELDALLPSILDKAFKGEL